ncbi:MAG: glycosyltransferase family 39 protein [Muribaculaceae bacterium]|nr:glycosyltransferase family 39 protein [Muribaculaceae bacterium]
MNRSRHTYVPAQPQILLLLLMALLLIPWLGQTWFNSKGEPREAIVAASILSSGNWILPVNYGGDIAFKPPFLYWCIAICAKIFNGGTVNEFISRLPSALALMAMVWSGFRWAWRVKDSATAWAMAAVTVTSVEVFRAGVACRLDMLVTALMVMSLYQLYYLTNPKTRHRAFRYVGVVLMMSAATMTKGPIGSALPCLIAGIYMLLRGQGFWRTTGMLAAVFICSLILPAWWFMEAWKQGGQHFYDLMMEENVGRLTGTMSYGSHVKPLYYNFLTILSGMAPWTLLMLMCGAYMRKIRLSYMRAPGQFMCVAAAATFIFYCIPQSKRSVYLLPMYPAMAYGVACAVLALRKSKALSIYRYIIYVLAILLLPAIIFLSVKADGIIIRMDQPQWWQWIFIALPLLTALFLWKERTDALMGSCTVTYALFLAYAAALMPAILRPQSDKPLTAIINEHSPAGATVYSLEAPGKIRFFTLNFYLDDRIRPVKTLTELHDMPQGTVVLYDVAVADSLAADTLFDHTRISKRGCDFRHPLYMGVRNNKPAAGDSLPHR